MAWRPPHSEYCRPGQTVVKGAFDRRVGAARLDATQRRAQVLSTISEVRHRLDPKVVLAEATTTAFDRLHRAIGDATTSAKSRPWILAAVATLAGVAISLRHSPADAKPGDNDAIEATNSPAES